MWQLNNIGYARGSFLLYTYTVFFSASFRLFVLPVTVIMFNPSVTDICHRSYRHGRRHRTVAIVAIAVIVIIVVVLIIIVAVVTYCAILLTFFRVDKSQFPHLLFKNRLERERLHQKTIFSSVDTPLNKNLSFFAFPLLEPLVR